MNLLLAFLLGFLIFLALTAPAIALLLKIYRKRKEDLIFKIKNKDK
jgi:hypothetical protein